ncbi:YbjQ family protein [Psychrobacter celer]|uniref:YbjQ family protein n=1 Tax=Psychrobacter celer TaxID=306572 RepID=UPI0018E02C27|nr:heavy metal-binding domain-containing protein [Psychrobacter celer]
MNQSFTQMLINYAPLLVLFVVGWFFGTRHERQHLAQLRQSEQTLGHIVVSSERFYRPKLAADTQGELVLGSVVIAQDYFKMIVARVLSIFGKNLTTYETLLDRARREAIVRMRTQAHAKGYNHIYGLRLEVTNVNQLGSMVEAIAYGTAVHSIDDTP